jgi:hypothetical protein
MNQEKAQDFCPLAPMTTKKQKSKLDVGAHLNDEGL